MSYDLTDDQAFRNWYEAEFGMAPTSSRDVHSLRSAFVAGQLHQLRIEREYMRAQADRCPICSKTGTELCTGLNGRPISTDHRSRPQSFSRSYSRSKA